MGTRTLIGSAIIRKAWLALLDQVDLALPSPKSIAYVRYLRDFPVQDLANVWLDTQTGAFTDDKVYIVQTNAKVVERCVLMATDPGDLVVDPTCGSGTTAYVAEQWGAAGSPSTRPRVALALARARIMGGALPYYLLADSSEGQRKEAEITRKAPSEAPTLGDVRQGFVYERVPHITLKSIANNTEVDVIWERWQETLEPLRDDLNARLDADWEEWQVPREASEDWPAETVETHRLWWEARIAPAAGDRRLHRGPGRLRVPLRQALRGQPEGPRGGTVHGGEPVAAPRAGGRRGRRAHRPRRRAEGRLRAAAGLRGHDPRAGSRPPACSRCTRRVASPLPPLRPGRASTSAAEGRYREGDGDAGPDKRAGIFVGPEFGTVARPDLVGAAREAGDAGFDVLIACAFNYEAHASEFNRLGRIPVLKARMNADLHMADELKNTGKGNLFVIFGEPDIDILPVGDEGDGGTRIQVRINGVDVFHPTHRRGPQRRRRRHRLLVHRHRLQRRELLRPTRLLPRRERPLQGAQDDAEGRDRRRRVGVAPQRPLAPVRPPRVGPHRRQGHQPPRRRGDEGVPGVTRRLPAMENVPWPAVNSSRRC